MLFEEGLGLYRMRRFEEAQARFEQAMQINPGDQPARTFVRRCQNLRATPPPPDWDGVTRTMEK
jgi:adenylate cyclase